MSAASLSERMNGALTAEAKHLKESVGRIVLIDFIFGMFMFVLGTTFFGLPLGTIVSVLLVAHASTRKSHYDDSRLNLFIVIAVLALAYASISSVTFGISTVDETVRRAFRISVVILLALFIGDKRIDARSLIFGIATGMMFNAAAYYAGIAPDAYTGFLTGWLGDKNVSGLWYAFIGLLFFTYLDDKKKKLLAFIFFSVLLWETGSRTSLAGYMFALLWLTFGKRIGLFAKFVLAIFIVWAVDYLTENYAQAGVFANRDGSDLLRARIDAATLEKVAQTPWHGQGLGQAYIFLPGGDDRRWLFHNSFYTLFVEGGWIWMFAVLLITLLAIFFWKQQYQKGKERIIVAEAAIVLLAICSWRLGEVILTIPWAITVGLGLSYLLKPKDAIGYYQQQEEQQKYKSV
ncbi:zinc ABC transporter permease [Rothia sp. CCM 9419]|uniref:zinc ABC transporter permease n=1 Tax=Rothia sp. CCM 9419 TaxID=3402662 RepID=UPI003AE79955